MNGIANHLYYIVRPKAAVKAILLLHNRKRRAFLLEYQSHVTGTKIIVFKSQFVVIYHLSKPCRCYLIEFCNGNNNQIIDKQQKFLFKIGFRNAFVHSTNNNM